MNINKYGAVFVSQEELFSSIYSGKVKNFKNLFLNDGSNDQFNASVKLNKDHIELIKEYEDPEEDIKLFDEANQCEWFMPEDYCPNLVEMLYGLCKTQEEKERVNIELELFIEHGMFDLLFYLKYLVDTMRENNIVWGVGRGSSVASFVLYLIGVHKINSIKFDLDIKEFLK